MITFLDRLVRHVDRKIHLIVDGHPNADVKTHVTARTSARTRTELADSARTHLRRRQNQPNRVKAFFRKPPVRYAAD